MTTPPPPNQNDAAIDAAAKAAAQRQVPTVNLVEVFGLLARIADKLNVPECRLELPSRVPVDEREVAPSFKTAVIALREGLTHALNGLAPALRATGWAKPMSTSPPIVIAQDVPPAPPGKGAH